MNQDIKLIIDHTTTRFNREVARAVRTGDLKALSRATEIRSELEGMKTILLVLDQHEEAGLIKSWQEKFYD